MRIFRDILYQPACTAPCLVCNKEISQTHAEESRALALWQKREGWQMHRLSSQNYHGKWCGLQLKPSPVLPFCTCLAVSLASCSFRNTYQFGQQNIIFTWATGINSVDYQMRILLRKRQLSKHWQTRGSKNEKVGNKHLGPNVTEWCASK